MRRRLGFLVSVAVLAGCGAAPVFERTGATPSVRLEFFAADTVPDPSRHRMTQLERTDLISSGGRPLYIDSLPVFTNVDVAKTRVVAFGDEVHRDEYAVELTLTPSASARFAEFTQSWVGHPLAMLVEGKLVSAPFVQERILGGKCQITVEGMGKEMVTRLAQGIVDTSSFRWPQPTVAPSP